MASASTTGDDDDDDEESTTSSDAVHVDVDVLAPDGSGRRATNSESSHARRQSAAMSASDSSAERALLGANVSSITSNLQAYPYVQELRV